MSTKMGYPSHYGDKGPSSTFVNKDNVIKIALIATCTTGMFISPAIAIDEAVVIIGGVVYKKAALEAVRSSACAASGACLVLASQSAKCGNISVATAFLCGAAICTCIDTTAKLASASLV
jgi:hypothetical protein